MVDLTLCDCGSGLRRLRCCGLDLALVSPVGAMACLAPLLGRAQTAFDEGDKPLAQALVLQLLELAPGYEPGLCLLYLLCRQQQLLSVAETVIRRVVTINPNHFWAINELTLLLLERSALVEAELHARNAVRIAPHNAQAHNLMGLVLTEANRLQVGEYHYRRVLELAADAEPITLANLAWNLKMQGRIEDSRALYLRAVALKPNVLQTLLGYAKMEEADRQFNRALEILDEAEQAFPANAHLRLTRATVLARLKRDEEALALLNQSETTQLSLGPAEIAEKGRLLDRMGRYDEAFSCFAQAKEAVLAAGGPVYLAEEAAQMALRLKGFFTSRRVAALPVVQTSPDTPQPVFILGFPRSGTTLVEQTLTAHSRIVAGDELPFITDITNIMPRLLDSPQTYPEALAELWMGDHLDGLDLLRDYYLSRARKAGLFSSGADFFTDKMPLNEMHLGLISLLFPQSPVIHVLRHPLDVVLSAYANFLTHGYFCAATLESIAIHYNLMFDLVEHYRESLNMRYLPLRYEDMVVDQEAQVRRLLAFVDVGFEPACLAFEQNKRYARTASYAQVTERLYGSSRYRYRAYLRHLAPVLEILKPTIERLGYIIEPSL